MDRLEAWEVGGDDRSSIPSLLGSPEPGETVHPKTDGAGRQPHLRGLENVLRKTWRLV